MFEELFLKVISNNGVAVAGFIYVLMQINPTLQKLTDAINNLNSDIDHRLDALEKEHAALRLEVSTLKKG